MSILVKSIKSTLSKSLKTPWVPSEVLRNDIRRSQGISIRVGYGNCYPLQCKSLHIPNTQLDSSEGTGSKDQTPKTIINIMILELKQYCVHHLADVTKQCSYKNLIPSLLFNSTNNMQSLDEKHVEEIINKSGEVKKWSETNIPGTGIPETSISAESSGSIQENITIKDVQQAEAIPDILTSLTNEIENGKVEIISLKNELKILETKRLKVVFCRIFVSVLLKRRILAFRGKVIQRERTKYAFTKFRY